LTFAKVKAQSCHYIVKYFGCLRRLINGWKKLKFAGANIACWLAESLTSSWLVKKVNTTIY
jgi:hypothetical protein